MERPNKIDAANLAALLSRHIPADFLQLADLVPCAYTLTRHLIPYLLDCNMENAELAGSMELATASLL